MLRFAAKFVLAEARIRMLAKMLFHLSRIRLLFMHQPHFSNRIHIYIDDLS